MKRTVILVILSHLFINLYCQTTTDSISVKQRLGPVFFQNGKVLTPGSLLKITQTNPEASAEMKIAHKNYMTSLIFQLPGGFLIGYPIGTSIAGGDPNWTLAAIGAGLVVISIPLISAYNKHAVNAVGIYNKGLRTSSTRLPELRFGYVSDGIGFQVRF